MFANWLVSDKLALWALIISIATGIIFPILKYLYQRYCKKVQIKIIPFNKAVFLYNESGSYAKLKFSIHCKNQDIVINRIVIEITTRRRTGQSETLEMDWNFFEPTNFLWLGSNMSNSINSTAYARPLKVGKDSLEPCIIEFVNNNQDARNDLNTLAGNRNNYLNEYISSLSNKDMTVRGAIDDFKRTEQYSELNDSYKKYLFWEAGEYNLKVIITYNENQKYVQAYKFTLDVIDSQKMEENIEKIIFCRLNQNHGFSAEFNALFKDLSG